MEHLSPCPCDIVQKNIDDGFYDLNLQTHTLKMKLMNYKVL